jgi:nucleotide-binding universal stress UspA family protein
VLEEAVFRRILVALGDGSTADRLGSAAANIALRSDAEVVFVHVADISGCCSVVDHPALHEHEQDLLRSQVEKLASRGLSARSEHRITASGRVAERLLEVAVESRADLLIIASARPGRLRGRSQRRVVHKVLHDAPCQVFVMPHAAAEPARPADRPGLPTSPHPVRQAARRLARRRNVGG